MIFGFIRIYRVLCDVRIKTSDIFTKNNTMKEFISIIQQNIQNNIIEIKPTEKDSLAKLKKNIAYLHESILRVKSFIINYEFRTDAEEINFFKEKKPQIYGQLLYQIRLYKIEENCPMASKVEREFYYAGELTKLNLITANSLDFYRYYRSGDSTFDRKYFLRNEYDLMLDKDPAFLEKDKKFSSSCDYEVANIIANDLLKTHITSQLESLKDKTCFDLITLISKNRMQWTASKVSLIELVYGIHSAKSINHGNVDLKDLITCFELIFNVNIGDFYRAFVEIRERKRSRTQYIDQMQKALTEKMNDLDK